jgi:hypothetical protein
MNKQKQIFVDTGHDVGSLCATATMRTATHTDEGDHHPFGSG